MQLVHTKTANRTIATIQIISCVATIIVTGLILAMIGGSIYGMLVIAR